MEKNLIKNKKILILGASSDIGVALVKIFLKKNWKVYAHYNQNNKNLIILKKNFKNLNLFKLSLSKPIKVHKFVLKNKFLKDIDSFVSLTGYLKLQKYNNFKVSEFYKHINVNYLNNQLFIRFILKNMIRKKWGRILVSSSIGTKFGGGLNTYVYSLTKYMNEFMPQTFKKYSNKNILYNSLQIGLTDTKLNYVDRNKNLKKRVSLVPMRRMAKVKEIADFIYYLSSENNTYISMQKISISGGE